MYIIYIYENCEQLSLIDTQLPSHFIIHAMLQEYYLVFTLIDDNEVKMMSDQYLSSLPDPSTYHR